MDIFQSEDIFFKTILLHWYNSECSFPTQRMKCGWSWRTMVVVERIWRIIIVENALWIRVTKKVCNFSVTNGMKNARISKFTFDFFTERDGLNGYFWLQMIEKGLIYLRCVMDFFLWKLQVENLHILHQNNEILHIFVELFIFHLHDFSCNNGKYLPMMKISKIMKLVVAMVNFDPFDR